jgi:hypothetical protein
MRRRLFAIIVSLALPLLAVGVAAPASAQTGLTADITSATLVAKGAAVDLQLSVSCEVGFTGGVFAVVTQRSGNTVMRGSGNTQFACTGESQMVILRVVADAGGAPFKTGDAVVSESSVQVCNDLSGCAFADLDQVIRIRK